MGDERLKDRELLVGGSAVDIDGPEEPGDEHVCVVRCEVLHVHERDLTHQRPPATRTETSDHLPFLPGTVTRAPEERHGQADLRGECVP